MFINIDRTVLELRAEFAEQCECLKIQIPAWIAQGRYTVAHRLCNLAFGVHLARLCVLWFNPRLPDRRAHAGSAFKDG